MKVLSKQPSSSLERNEMVTFARFDLYPDGNGPRAPALGTLINSSQIFPRLLHDAMSAAAGWQLRDDRDNTTIRYEPLARFDVRQAYHELYRNAEKSGGNAVMMMTRARTIPAKARAKVAISEAVPVLGEALENHDDFAPSQIRDAQRFAELIGHPAPTCEVKVLEGKTHSLEQYRDTVLVLFSKEISTAVDQLLDCKWLCGSSTFQAA